MRALCTTRRVERHDSIITFRELYPHIVVTLEELEEETDREYQLNQQVLSLV